MTPNSLKPIIYQLLPRLFGNRNVTRKEDGMLAENGCGKLNDIDGRVLRLIKKMGVTHVWYTGVIRHATQTDYTQFGIPHQHPAIVKGKAGSPYAIVDYYDIDPDLAVDVPQRMQEFDALLRRTHEAGLKVIIDFVPNHVARQYRSICRPEGVRDLGEDDDVNNNASPDNNFFYCVGEPFAPQFDINGYEETPAKATGNDCFNAHPNRNDWYETVKLNYHSLSTWQKMTDILLFWAAKGVDGFRCDMAEMVPVEFWQYAVRRVKEIHPSLVFIGEVYQPQRYRDYLKAGFDWLYDKVGMYDCLRAIVCGHQSTADITQQWQANDDIHNQMLYFLENHDEQRLASDFFAGDARRGIPALMVSVWMRNNPFMLYAGQEFGERGMDCEGFSGRDGRTTIFDYWSLDTLINGYFDRRHQCKEEKTLAEIYRSVLAIAQNEQAIGEGQFFDLMYVNPQLAHSQYAFLRKCHDELLIIAVNFAENDVAIDVRIPQHAFDILQLPTRPFSATDLLTQEQTVVNLLPDVPIHINIDAHAGCILKIKLF